VDHLESLAATVMMELPEYYTYLIRYR